MNMICLVVIDNSIITQAVQKVNCSHQKGTIKINLIVPYNQTEV